GSGGRSSLCFALYGRRHAAITPQSSVDSEAGVSELEDDSISMSYKLQDMTDVEVMARLQEESLRQDYASTSATPRLFRTGSMQRAGLPHSHTFSSIRDCRRSSNTLSFLSVDSRSTVGPPASSQTHTAYRNSTGEWAIDSPPFFPSPGQLSQRVQSVGNFPTTTRHPLKATAYVSPTVLHSIPSSAALSQPLKPSGSLLPQALKAGATGPSAIPRSSLPRPASFVGTSAVPRASKITQPTRRYFVDSPKSLAAMSALRDSSWKDGCF
uniref:SLAIN motif family, member 1a n=1 Tax=Salarias fasciatus TaxID=181472 RepID=A0A672FY05_SALFA